jgi:hypothetical protein
MESINPDVWRLPQDTLAVCLASDEQKIERGSWPLEFRGHCADIVITPTKEIIL